MLAFLLSPPCDDEPRSIGEARRLAPLRLEGGIPAAGLDGKQKRRWTLFFPSILPGTRQVPERVTAWARYHDWYFGCAGNLPARTCRSSSTNSKRFSPGVSPSLSRATTSASNIPTIAISTLILWSP